MKRLDCHILFFVALAFSFCRFSYGETGKNVTKILVTKEKEKVADPRRKRIVCYTSEWDTKSAGRSKFDINEVIPAMPLCSHIIYYYLDMDDNDNITSINPVRDSSENGVLARLVKAGRRHRHLKLMIGIGAFGDASDKYSNMIASAERRRNFIQNSVDFLKKYDLDGLDIDWDYAGNGGNPEQDKINLVIFAKEIRDEFDKHNFITSYFVTVDPDRIAEGLNFRGLSNHAHFLSLYTYEYHGQWDKQVLPSAPLYGPESTVESSIELFKQLGTPLDKINLGLTNFGMSYLLYEKVDEYEDVIGKVAKDTGFSGPYYNLPGYISYNELCLFLKDPAWKIFYDPESNVKFAVNDEKVVSFDDAETFYDKVMFGMVENVGGFVYFGLEKDDYRSDCGFGKYPLLNKIKSTINEYPKFLELLKRMKEKNAHYFWNLGEDVSSNNIQQG